MVQILGQYLIISACSKNIFASEELIKDSTTEKNSATAAEGKNTTRPSIILMQLSVMDIVPILYKRLGIVYALLKSCLIIN